MKEEFFWGNGTWISPVSDIAENESGWGRKIETVFFRHLFEVNDENATLSLSISASSRYRLWVNGSQVLSGPCKSNRWEKHYETVDVTSLLKTGANIIAVKVVAFPPYEAQAGNERSPFWFMGNAAGPVLIVKGLCLNANKSVACNLSTGIAKWEYMRDSSVSWDMQWMSFWMGAMEVVNMQGYNEKWMLLDDASGEKKPEHTTWRLADKRWKAKSDGFGEIMPFPLSERPIPLCYEKTIDFVSEMPIKPSDYSSFSCGLPFHEVKGTDAVSVKKEYPLLSNNLNRGSHAHRETNDQAAVIKPHTHSVIELDAGEITSAYFSTFIEGGKNSRITFIYAENYADYSGPRPVRNIRDDSMNGSIKGNQDQVIASGRHQTYQPFLFRTFRFVRIEVLTEDEPLTLHLPELTETGYPLVKHSSIVSTESWIEPIWDMSVRTLQRCMHETYMDCPYYEQLQYTMDTRLQMLYTYALSGDDRLAVKAIADYHSSLLPEGMLQSRFPSDLPQVIPAFSLYWIFMLEEHWWQTGSTEQFKRYRPTVDAVLDWFDRKARPEDGLITDLGHWDFADWVVEWDERHGVPFAIDEGPSTIHNLVYATALQSAARMMKETGRPDVSDEYTKRADNIAENIEKLCWDEVKGLYMDGPGFIDYTQHSQVWAVLSGLAEGEKATRIMKNSLIVPELSKCSFPWMFTLFRALEKANVYELTEGLWDLWKGLIPQHLTTIPEIPVNTRSDCHAWGALPLYEFTHYVLGVRPLEPGWTKILIEPAALFIADASGEVITPKGIVSVSWKKEGDRFTLVCQGPQFASLQVKLPDGSVHMVKPGENQIFSCTVR